MELIASAYSMRRTGGGARDASKSVKWNKRVKRVFFLGGGGGRGRMNENNLKIRPQLIGGRGLKKMHTSTRYLAYQNRGHPYVDGFSTFSL